MENVLIEEDIEANLNEENDITDAEKKYLERKEKVRKFYAAENKGVKCHRGWSRGE